MNSVLGMRITQIRAMTREEQDQEGWTGRLGNAALVLDGGAAVLYASRDPEGNGPGALFFGSEGDVFMVACPDRPNDAPKTHQMELTAHDWGTVLAALMAVKEAPDGDDLDKVTPERISALILKISGHLRQGP